MEFFFQRGLAESTKRTYSVAWSRYQRCCEAGGGGGGGGGMRPLPVSEPGLCKFVASLAVEGLAANSIRIYPAEVRHAQIERGGQDPQWGSMLRLGQVLRGVRRCRAEEGFNGRVRHPMSPDMLLKLRSSWEKRAGWDSIMLWAAVCMCYFGCTRAGEITAPERGSFDRGPTSPSRM